MARAHECPLTAVWKMYARREVAFGSFDSLRPQTCGDCTKQLSNDTNGTHTVIVGFVEVSSLLVLRRVATAGKSV